MNEWLITLLLASVVLNLFLGLAWFMERSLERRAMKTNDFLVRQVGALMDIVIEERSKQRSEDHEDS